MAFGITPLGGGIVGKKAKSFPGARVVYYKPEMRTCPHCGTKLRFLYVAGRKYVTTLTETIYAVSLGYQCPTDGCQGHRIVFRSATGEALSLKNHSYGMDVVAEIGYLRFQAQRTRAEIHQAIRDLGVLISEREVQNLYEEYLLLLQCSAGDRLAERRAQMVENGGITISLDGIQPEKGNETLWVVRDVLTGMTLHAANLVTSDGAHIKELLRPVLDMGLPILGVVSDAQKAIRNAVGELLPGVPHQLCHFHFMRNIALPAVNDDRALKTDLKHELRGITAIQQSVAGNSDATAKTVEMATTAVRAALLEDGQPPLDLPGVKIYEHLEGLSQALQKCLEKKGPQS